MCVNSLYDSPIIEESVITKSNLRTLEITHSILGKKLRKPIIVKAPMPSTKGQELIQKFIVDAFTLKMPALISFSLPSSRLFKLAKHIYRQNSKSTATLYQYVYGVYRFCKWSNKDPDQLIEDCLDDEGLPISKRIDYYTQILDEFVSNLEIEGLAPGTIANHVKGVKALYRVNGIKLELPYRLSKRIRYNDRSPTPEELQQLIDIGTIRDKVIISLLALGGFRIGTLCQLKYRHVKRDYERKCVPLHVHIEAEITKGKYHDYDTFLGQEAYDYLKAYLELRERGSPCGKIPPETLRDESPFIRNELSRTPTPLTPTTIHRTIHNLYIKAGLLTPRKRVRYELRPHSIRKFFRTQLAALGLERDYIEYMMGHTISTYHDIRMKGIEFLRNVYRSSGISIKPKTRISKIDALKEIVRAYGLNPEEVLTKEALSMPHRTVVSNASFEENQIKALSKALRNIIRDDLKQ